MPAAPVVYSTTDSPPADLVLAVDTGLDLGLPECDHQVPDAQDHRPGGKRGVNLGNFAPELIAQVRVRRFDGAETWTFIDA